MLEEQPTERTDAPQPSQLRATDRPRRWDRRSLWTVTVLCGAVFLYQYYSHQDFLPGTNTSALHSKNDALPQPITSFPANTSIIGTWISLDDAIAPKQTDHVFRFRDSMTIEVSGRSFTLSSITTEDSTYSLMDKVSDSA